MYILGIYMNIAIKVDDKDYLVIYEDTSFEWDEWNVEKNRILHGVLPEEQEQVFFDEGKVIYEDTTHSIGKERRFLILGRTKVGRKLYIAFTIRNNKIRIISARDLNRREVSLLI
jgi:uncharacterized protein